MKQRLKKGLGWLIRLLVIAAAITYIAFKVDWVDHAVLKEGSRHVSVFGEERRADGLYVLVEADGVRSWRPESDFQRPRTKIQDQVLPVVTPGLRSVVSQIEWMWVIIALACFSPNYVILAWRLRMLLFTQEVRLRLIDAIKVNYAAAFLNFAVPTGTTGGDIYKAYYVAAHATGRRTEAVTVVLLDRAIGLVNFVFMAAMVCLLNAQAGRVGVLGQMVGTFCAVCLVVGGSFFSQRVRRLMRLEEWLPKLPFGGHLVRIDRTAFSLRHHPRSLMAAFGSTMIGQINVCVCAMLLARATRMDCQFAVGHVLEYFLAVIVGLTVSSLPGNPPQGFGVLEGIMAYVLVPHYGNWSQIFAVCIGVRLLHLIWSLPGALVLLIDPMPKNIQSMDDASGVLPVPAQP